MSSKNLRLFLLCIAMGSWATAAEPGAITITVKKMHCMGCAKKIAARLYEVAGVAEVKVDVKTKTLLVESERPAALSPRELWTAIEKAKDIPVRLEGPVGTFTQKPPR